jgi:hypothetical protein
MDVRWMLRSSFQGAAVPLPNPRRRGYPSLRMDFTSLNGPAFVSRYRTHPSAGADQRVRTDLVADGARPRARFLVSSRG